jgi:outer membrane protein assembly factor BamB
MGHFLAMFWGPVVAALAFLIWWLFFSRLPWSERWLGLGVCVAAGVATAFLGHPSYRIGLVLHGLPVVTTAWILCLVACALLNWPGGQPWLAVVLLLTWGYFALIRFHGAYGSLRTQLYWRWDPTPEDNYKAKKGDARPAVLADAPAVKLEPGDWPAFRGPARDGRLPGVRIATDWKANPPKPVWSRSIGPGWSSFAVVGGRLYTQEQFGEEERVVCLDPETGKEIWVHSDTTRFQENVSGAGPRATPTFDDGKLYTLGGKGRLNCLDAATGKVIWSRDVVADSGAKVPIWGFASSPLVLEGVVTVFAGNPADKGVMAYHAATGEPAWSGGKGGHGYSSTQRARLGGMDQVLVTSDFGLTAYHPTSGKVLWEHGWSTSGMSRMTQPAVLDESDVLLGTWMGQGMRRLRLTRDGDNWAQQEVWASKAISPYYNDLVVHKGHAYGFHGNFLACINLADGSARWRARGYDHGQLLLLADQDLLLVLAETGDVALVRADPESRQELARFSALKGKCWNHPVVAHGKLFVRNDEEAACYELKEVSGDGK